MKNLSVIIITYNEADNIKACLESVKWADEIVVVDSFSDDDTVKICRLYTDKVYQNRFEGYAAQKNFALDKSTGEWVLSIDADEIVSPRLKSEITAAAGRVEAVYNGYCFPRKNYLGDRWIKHCGLYPDNVLRLFRRTKGRFGERLVHESVTVTGSIGKIREPLEHYTFRSIDDMAGRMKYYAGLAARQMIKDGRKSGWYNIIFNPVFTFLKLYLVRLGFLDGRAGLVISLFYSYYTFLKYKKMLNQALDKVSL